MSLEQALAENTAAIKAQTELLKSLGAKGAATTTTTAKAETAKAETAKTAKPGKPAAGKVTEETLRKEATTFLTTQDAEERENRKNWVGKINEYYGVTKISEAPADKWADIVRMLKQLSTGETPPELEGEAEETPADDMI